MKAGDKVRITGAKFPDASEELEAQKATLSVEAPGGWIVVLDKNSASQPLIKSKWLKVES